MLLLRFNSGPRSDETVLLDKNKTMFGRGVTCDCSLNHPTVSREHFAIERTGNKYLAVDQDSGNGTFVNGDRISWIEIKQGDRIQAGPFSFVVELSDEDHARMKTPDFDKDAAREGEDDATGDDEQAFGEAHRKIYPREYLDGINHFNARQYYDAHEVWEEIWLHSSGDTKLFYQMLIQAAVGLHHYERGNARGGRGMYKAVTEKLTRLPGMYMSLDLDNFSHQYKSFFAELIENDNESAPPADRPRPFIRLTYDDLGI
jgi:uncharacterized protein